MSTHPREKWNAFKSIYRASLYREYDGHKHVFIHALYWTENSKCSHYLKCIFSKHQLNKDFREKMSQAELMLL